MNEDITKNITKIVKGFDWNRVSWKDREYLTNMVKEVINSRSVNCSGIPFNTKYPGANEFALFKDEQAKDSYKEEFYEYTIANFTKEEEKRIVQRFSDYLWKISNKEICIYHWGHAEYNYFRYIHETYPTIQFPPYKLINVLDYFRMEPILEIILNE